MWYVAQRDRQKSMYAEQLQLGDEYTKKLGQSELDREPSTQVKAIKNYLQDLKQTMANLEKSQMDIGRTPLVAMDQISQPLLQAMRLKVDTSI